jgi:hypothetical protein
MKEVKVRSCIEPSGSPFDTHLNLIRKYKSRSPQNFIPITYIPQQANSAVSPFQALE